MSWIDSCVNSVMFHVISVICYLMCICACTSYYFELVVGLTSHAVRDVGGWDLTVDVDV